jgi:CIC family chloride channel protein
MVDRSERDLKKPTLWRAPTGMTRTLEEIRTRLRLESRQLTLGEQQVFLLLAVIIGLFSGLAVILFRISIEYTRILLLGSGLRISTLRVLLAPSVAGLGLALLVMKVFPRARGSGVNQTKAAVYIYDGYVPFRTVIGKFVTCALAIGSGQSLGPEDPSLQMGAGIASALGRRMHFSRDKVRLIAPVGAAAGLAAAFNAPISATVFVIEEVIGKWSAGVLGAIILSAVSSVVMMRWFLGAQPLFRVPVYLLVHPAELLAYAALGVIGGVASLVFLRLVLYLRPRLKALPRPTHYFQPALAGLAIGVIGIWLPQIMGAGYQYIDQAMHDQYPWRILLLLGAFKIIATTLSFATGTPGGIFAPTLFVGAMIGGAVGGIERHFFPGLTGPVGTYALVGMGTLFAGFLRVPMTSVFMVLELSGNYSIILPVMISNTIAYLISRQYHRMPLFDLLSKQDNVDLPSMEERREAQTLLVEDAMQPFQCPILNIQDSVTDALSRLGGATGEFFLVEDGRGKWYGITKDMLGGAVVAWDSDVAVGSVLRGPPLPHVHPDQALDVALSRLADAPFLPVVHRADLTRLEGVVSLKDILKAYREAHLPTKADAAAARNADLRP